MAIEHANTIVDWQENLGEDEVPPEWMWHLDSELIPWFEEVKRKRDEKYGIDRDDDSGGSKSRRESVPMMDNELASARRRR